jgi:hypothetical protein
MEATDLLSSFFRLATDLLSSFLRAMGGFILRMPGVGASSSSSRRLFMLKSSRLVVVGLVYFHASLVYVLGYYFTYFLGSLFCLKKS